MHHPRRSRVRTGPRLLLVLLSIVAFAANACGASDGSPSPTSGSAAPSSGPSAAIDEDAIFDEIEAQVVAIRGLQPKAKVDREVIDEARLREIFTAQFDEESPPAYVAATERLYKALGLIPEDADLKQTQLDMLSAGVAGFYRDDEKKMYVVSRMGSLSAADKVTYAHEYTHALQDQHYTVFKDQKKVLDRSDWMMGRQAVYEGDATTVMSYWLVANLTSEELASILQGGSAAEQQAVLDSMPAILRETLMYPYTTGYLYVQAAQMSGGWPKVDAFYDAMPESTEQILHPDKYLAGEAPVAVIVPKGLAKDLGKGWTVPLEDTFGELQMGIWLHEGGVAAAAAKDAAAGWGGDRLAVINGPDGAWALAMQTAWDTPEDAAAFETAASTALGKAGGPGQVLPGAGGNVRWVVIGNDDQTLGKVAGVLGLAG